MSAPSPTATRRPAPAPPAYGADQTPPMSGSLRQDFALFLDANPQAPGDSLRAWLDLAEAWRIRQALVACRGNRTAAARLLGIGRRTLYAKMSKLEIGEN